MRKAPAETPGLFDFVEWDRMNIDERLDRLTERHEALTQTVESMAHLQQEAHQKYDEALAKNQILLAQVIESSDSLARIAQAHERRLSDLEGSRQ